MPPGTARLEGKRRSRSFPLEGSEASVARRRGAEQQIRSDLGFLPRSDRGEWTSRPSLPERGPISWSTSVHSEDRRLHSQTGHSFHIRWEPRFNLRPIRSFSFASGRTPWPIPSSYRRRRVLPHMQWTVRSQPQGVFYSRPRMTAGAPGCFSARRVSAASVGATQ